jgi:hypothetical protein
MTDKMAKSNNRWDDFCIEHSSFCSSHYKTCVFISDEDVPFRRVFEEWYWDTKQGHFLRTLYIDICAACTMPAMWHTNDRCLIGPTKFLSARDSYEGEAYG